MLDVDAVRALVRAGRVRPSPRFHGFEHGFTYHGAATALEYVRKVEPDLRPGPSGIRRHPHGWRAFCAAPDGRQIGVDFDLQGIPGDEMIAIVTAYVVRR